MFFRYFFILYFFIFYVFFFVHMFSFYYPFVHRVCPKLINTFSLSLSLCPFLFFLSPSLKQDETSLKNFELAIYTRELRLLCLAATSIARIISISLPFEKCCRRRAGSRSREYPA